MNLNLKRVAQSLAITTVFAIGGALEVNAQTDVFTDTFDALPTNGATRVFTPDLSATGGTFPGSPFDVFGIVDRNVNFDFADDSVALNVDPANPVESDGIIPAGRTDFFLGFEDTNNGDNESGDVRLTWTVSAAGATDLSLSFEIAAMGDFEASDLLTVTASFDGGAAETVFESAVDDDAVLTYTLEDGTTVDLNDPFAIDGVIVSNVFQTLTFPITGTGSELTLTLDYNTNGGGEVLAIDNVSVTAGGDGGGGEVLKGDVEMDGDIDFSDIPEFISVLQSGVFQAEADCDCSGEVDFGDIPVFIMILQSQ